MKLKPINLIPKNALKKPPLKWLNDFASQNRQLSKLIVLGIIFVFFFFAVPALMANGYKLNVAFTKRAIDETKIRLKNLQSQDFQTEKIKAGLVKEETLLNQRLDLLNSTAVKNNGYSGLLLSVSGLLPKDLWINRFTMNDNEIQLSGSTLNSQLIADFMNKLEASKDFRNTRFVSTEKQVIESHTIYNFQIVSQPSWSKKRAFFSAAVQEKAQK